MKVYIKQLQSLKTLTDCKDTDVVVPAGCGKSAIFYMIQRKFQMVGW